MAKAKDVLMDHEYDGIKEYDNPLPPWWLYMFYITIVIGVVYLVYYHVLGMGNLPIAEYNKEMASAKKAVAASSSGTGASSMGGEIKALTDEGSLKAGKEIYTKNCVPCHGESGEGKIGPNFSDNYWIHGDGKIAGVVKIISEGVPAKGMLTWSTMLSPQQILQVGSYVLTFQGTTPPNPKAPEGKEVTP